MVRLKCKKCKNVFEIGNSSAVASNVLVHVGPLTPVKCPACGKRSWLNVYSSVKDPITWPPEAVKEQQSVIQPELSEEELEKKRIEESKYEKP